MIQIHMGSRPPSLLRDFRLDGFVFSMSEDRLGETTDRMRACVRDIAELLTLRPYRFSDVYVLCNTCAL